MWGDGVSKAGEKFNATSWFKQFWNTKILQKRTKIWCCLLFLLFATMTTKKYLRKKESTEILKIFGVIDNTN